MDPALFAVLRQHAHLSAPTDPVDGFDNDGQDEVTDDMVDAQSQYADKFFDHQKKLSGSNKLDHSFSYVEACRNLGIDPADARVGSSETGYTDVTLEAHQVKGVNWLVEMRKKETRGALLSDDTGLGKTITALVYLAGNCRLQAAKDVGPYRPRVIVMPAGLMTNWFHDFRIPHVPFHAVSWEKRESNDSRYMFGIFIISLA